MALYLARLFGLMNTVHWLTPIFNPFPKNLLVFTNFDWLITHGILRASDFYGKAEIAV